MEWSTRADTYSAYIRRIAGTTQVRAVIYPNHRAPDIFQTFDTVEDARRWIETRSA